jgi:hypothetical protein
LSAWLVANCAGSGAKKLTPGEPPLVYDVTVEPADGALTVHWRAERTPGQAFAGYHVYITPEGSQAAVPFNQAPYPGDTDGDPTRESFEARPLENGVRYLCSVASLYTDGTTGTASSPIPAVCRPGGRVKLQPLFSGDFDGLDFSTGAYVTSDDSECHIVFLSKGSADSLLAPSRIDPLNNETRFWDLGRQTSFAADLEIRLKGTGLTQVPVQVEHTYVYRTPDDHYGKFYVESISLERGIPTIHLEYMYQPIPELLDLR